jgi:signal transduction histidine kinase
MFHRLDSGDARETYGHGLGLHLVKRMLEAMGGGIRAESGPTQGARMVFWLPRADVPPVANVQPERTTVG